MALEVIEVDPYEGISKLYPPSVLREMKALYKDGMSRDQIAAIYIVDPTTVSRYLRLMGVKMRPQGGSSVGRKLKPGQLYQMKYLYLTKKLPQHEVGAILGMGKTSVGYYLKQAGIPLRTRQERALLERERRKAKAQAPKGLTRLVQ